MHWGTGKMDTILRITIDEADSGRCKNNIIPWIFSFLVVNFEVSWKCMEHLFVFLHCYGLIGFKVSSPKESFALESADRVSPPLFSPDPLEVERIVASPCCCLCSGANHLQSAQELCLGPDSNYGQCPSQEGSCQSQLSVRSPHLPLLPLWGPATLTLEMAKWWIREWRSSDPVRQPTPPSPSPMIPVWSQLVQWCQARCHNTTGRCFSEKPEQL